MIQSETEFKAVHIVQRVWALLLNVNECGVYSVEEE